MTKEEIREAFEESLNNQLNRFRFDGAWDDLDNYFDYRLLSAKADEIIENTTPEKAEEILIDCFENFYETVCEKSFKEGLIKKLEDSAGSIMKDIIKDFDVSNFYKEVE